MLEMVLSVIEFVIALLINKYIFLSIRKKSLVLAIENIWRSNLIQYVTILNDYKQIKNQNPIC